jgi:hypothetical protein
VAQCKLVEFNDLLDSLFNPEDGSSMFLPIIGKLLLDYMASYLTKTVLFIVTTVRTSNLIIAVIFNSLYLF